MTHVPGAWQDVAASRRVAHCGTLFVCISPLLGEFVKRLCLRLALAAAVMLTMTSSALAWSSFSSFNTRAAGLTFSGAELSSPNSGKQQCRVRVRLKTKAPDTSARTLFVVVGTNDGKTILATVPFTPKTAGNQWVSFWYDTSHKGCWAAKIQRPRKLEVRGCKGKGCKPS